MTIVTLIGFGLVLLVALCLALLAWQRGDEADPRAFFAARGQFGAVFFFLLSVGETYSIGSVLGFPGGIVASRSADVALWFVGYILLAFPVGTLLFPRLWEAGQRYGAITLPDLLGSHHKSPVVSWVTGCILVLLMLPLGTMQFLGLGHVLAGLGLASSPVLMSSAAAFLAFCFVAIAGLRGAAMTSALKDAMVLFAVLAVALVAVLHWPQQRTHALADILKMGSARPDVSLVMILTTIIVQALGFCIAPQTAASVFSARGPDSIGRAQIWMPLYMLLFPLLFLIAAFALTHNIGSYGTDRVFLDIASALLPDWMYGLILGGVALTALVWLGAVCLSIAAIVSRNIVPHVPATAQKRLGLIVIALYLAFSVVTAQMQNVLIVTLNRLFYVGLVQLLPAVLLCFCKGRVSPACLLVALGVGLVVGAGLFFSALPFAGISPALPGLLCNVAILAGGYRCRPAHAGR